MLFQCLAVVSGMSIVDQRSNTSIPLLMGIITTKCLFGNLETTCVTEMHATIKFSLAFILGKLAWLPLRFCHHPETCSASIRQILVMEARNNRIK